MKTEFIPTGRRWSRRDIWDVLGMIEEGKSNKDIAEHYGVTTRAIAALKRDHDLPRRTYRFWTQPELNEIRALLRQGKSIMDIADMLKVKYNRLERCIAYHNLDNRR